MRKRRTSDPKAEIARNAARFGFDIPEGDLEDMRAAFARCAAEAGFRARAAQAPHKPFGDRPPAPQNVQRPPGTARAAAIEAAIAAGLPRWQAMAEWQNHVPQVWRDWEAQENRKVEMREAAQGKNCRVLRPTLTESVGSDATVPRHLRAYQGRKPPRGPSDNPDPHRLTVSGHTGAPTGRKCQVNAAVALLVDEALENL